MVTWQGIRLPFGKNMRFVRVHAVVLVVGAVVLVVGQVRFGGILCGWRVRVILPCRNWGPVEAASDLCAGEVALAVVEKFLAV